jgi:hypothetical protein
VLSGGLRIPVVRRSRLCLHRLRDRRTCLRLLWPGFQSFERQHQALATLAAEQLEADLEALASDCKAYCPLSMSTSTLPATRAEKLVALEAIGDIIL